MPPELEALGVAARKLPPRRLPFDDRWRRAAADALADLGIGQKELGRLIGAAQGTLSNVLGAEPAAWHSDYVERISTLLRIDLPAQARFQLLGERAAREGGPEGVQAMLEAFEALFRARRR